ncbi:hypothetical protein HPB50_026138 [Hyalomma asiaticum]|uniref:Uncharacterized protein n=1 Tax=Hyalomma asiaticum TaxID=266040 RepID=A0ACB7SFZ4_HYAAI|nr:hypothetical protein HPB50_026138 [Hyalomma asiaticum]
MGITLPGDAIPPHLSVTRVERAWSGATAFGGGPACVLFSVRILLSRASPARVHPGLLTPSRNRPIRIGDPSAEQLSVVEGREVKRGEEGQGRGLYGGRKASARCVGAFACNGASPWNPRRDGALAGTGPRASPGGAAEKAAPSFPPRKQHDLLDPASRSSSPERGRSFLCWPFPPPPHRPHSGSREPRPAATTASLERVAPPRRAPKMAALDEVVHPPSAPRPRHTCATVHDVKRGFLM